MSAAKFLYGLGEILTGYTCVLQNLRRRSLTGCYSHKYGFYAHELVSVFACQIFGCKKNVVALAAQIRFSTGYARQMGYLGFNTAPDNIGFYS